MVPCLKQVEVSDRREWRRWLARNHDKQESGIWLVFHKQRHGLLGYEEAVEEALCFGWIDSLIKRIDDDRYCRKFTPRKDESVWSPRNKERVQKLLAEGRMTAVGLAKVEAAKRSGRWAADPRPAIAPGIPRDLAAALAVHNKAEAFFDNLAPSHRKHFLAWLAVAKRPETRARRIRECLALLGKGHKLGLK